MILEIDYLHDKKCLGNSYSMFHSRSFLTVKVGSHLIEPEVLESKWCRYSQCINLNLNLIVNCEQDILLAVRGRPFTQTDYGKHIYYLDGRQHPVMVHMFNVKSLTGMREDRKYLIDMEYFDQMKESHLRSGQSHHQELFQFAQSCIRDYKISTIL